jgi:uncharacterized membrane protein
MSEQLIKEAILWMSLAVEALAALIIAVGTIEAAFKTIKLVMAADQEKGNKLTRMRLGGWLALALEFLLAADILRTAIAPTWSEIGQLAAIATIRTALNYFLEREIVQEERIGNVVPAD